MTRASEKALKAKLTALSEHLRTATSAPDAVSLSRSYGLPQPEVEKIIRSVCYAH